MKNKKNKLPGMGWRILSFIPALNWISLLYIGIINSSAVSVVCAITYCLATFVFPSLSFILWIVGIIHYHIAYCSMQNQKNKFMSIPTALPEFSPQYEDLQPSNTEEIRNFSDITISGEIEQRQTIPSRTIPANDLIHDPFSLNSSQINFFSDMQKYASVNGEPAAFVPFMSYWPTYDSMNTLQKAWYFYWRSQVRQGNYVDTDLSYIFILMYELLSAVGWKTPQEGYEYVLQVWLEYRNTFPNLDRYLSNWTFDFAQLHGLEYTIPFEGNPVLLVPSTMTDILIEQHVDDIPLNLQFSLINALCDYSLAKSKFYDDNQGLMQEAIPRVVVLADAVLRKKTKMGILKTYGPEHSREQMYYAFKNSVCPQANTRITHSVKAYSKNKMLREYITELVRYSENVLRELKGYHGYLRGFSLDDETEKLIKSFLEKEYEEPVPQANEGAKKVELNLNFENINILREESDAVRTALQVEKSIVPVEEALLTDIHEVTALYISLSYEARHLLDRLEHSNWECELVPEDEILITEINRLAKHYLGYALLVKEENIVMAEDNYRDELAYIYENPPQLLEMEDIARQFDVSVLPSELREFVEYLVPEQQKALHVLLTCEQPKSKLEQIAEESMTMPQILLDQINEVAMQIFGDLLVEFRDQEPHISDEYITLLKRSIV